MEKEISTSARIFLGVFLFLLAAIGITANTIVVTVLRFRSDFKRKTTNTILTSLASIGFFGCAIDIPLALSTMVASPAEFHRRNLLLAQAALGSFLFWGYITSFFLLSIDLHDTLRRALNRQAYLSTKRISMVLTLAAIPGVGISAIFVIKGKYFIPYVPLDKGPIFLTIIRSVLFIALVISVSSNIYYFLKIRKLIKSIFNDVGTSSSRTRRNQKYFKGRDISWTVILIILVFCFSYLPYMAFSIVYVKAEVRCSNAIVICQSFTYLKYAVSSLIFARADGRFLKVFVNIVRRAARKQEEHRNKSEDTNAINRRQTTTIRKKDFSRSSSVQHLVLGEGIEELAKTETRESMNHLNQPQTILQAAVASPHQYYLPKIMITTPEGGRTILFNQTKFQ